MMSERTIMENRIEQLEDGLENTYVQYRLKHPDSEPLPLFMSRVRAATLENAMVTDEVDGSDGEPTSISKLSNSYSAVTSVTSLPSVTSLLSNLHHTRPRGDRHVTTTVGELPPASKNMENIASKMASAGSPPKTSHHFLNTTPPSSPIAERSTTSPLMHSKAVPTSTPSAQRHGHSRQQRKNAHAISTTPTSSRYSYPAGASPHALSQPEAHKEWQVIHRNSLPENFINSTIFEEITSSGNLKANATKRYSGFRKRSTSSGNIERPRRSSQSQLLTRKISQDSLKKQDSNSTISSSSLGWFEDV
jgi:hypothetical protein